MKAEKLELKSAMKADEDCQSGSDTMWEKVVKILIQSAIYILYLQRNLRKKNKLIIPINQDNPYKSEIILLNTHFPNLIYNYILHKYIQETSNRKIQVSNKEHDKLKSLLAHQQPMDQLAQLFGLIIRPVKKIKKENSMCVCIYIYYVKKRNENHSVTQKAYLRRVLCQVKFRELERRGSQWRRKYSTRRYEGTWLSVIERRYVTPMSLGFQENGHSRFTKQLTLFYSG